MEKDTLKNKFICPIDNCLNREVIKDKKFVLMFRENFPGSSIEQTCEYCSSNVCRGNLLFNQD